MNGRRCRNAVRGRFKADGGEVVVGRVTEIQGGRWIVDIDGVQEAVLMLASGDMRGAGPCICVLSCRQGRHARVDMRW